MKIIEIPSFDDMWDDIQIMQLSPSTFTWLGKGCSYQILLQKCIQMTNCENYALPKQQSSILGTIVHKIYEQTSNGVLHNVAEIIIMWDKLVSIEKKKLVSLYPTLCNVNLNDYDKRNKAVRYAMGIIKNRSTYYDTTSKYTAYNEKFLDCPNLGLRGVIDKLIVKDKQFDVIDYKTGDVFDVDGNIKEEYYAQLHLYAAMCEDLGYGVADKLTLIDINGFEHKLDVCREKIVSLVSDVKHTLEKINSVLAVRNFDTLIKNDNGQCDYCNCRHVCKYKVFSDNAMFSTVDGVLIEIKSSNLYVLQSEKKIFYVSGLSVYSIENEDVYIGCHLVFVNVMKNANSSDDLHYKIIEKTILYELK